MDSETLAVVTRNETSSSLDAEAEDLVKGSAEEKLVSIDAETDDPEANSVVGMSPGTDWQTGDLAMPYQLPEPKLCIPNYTDLVDTSQHYTETRPTACYRPSGTEFAVARSFFTRGWSYKTENAVAKIEDLAMALREKTAVVGEAI